MSRLNIPSCIFSSATLQAKAKWLYNQDYGNYDFLGYGMTAKIDKVKCCYKSTLKAGTKTNIANRSWSGDCPTPTEAIVYVKLKNADDWNSIGATTWCNDGYTTNGTFFGLTAVKNTIIKKNELEGFIIPNFMIQYKLNNIALSPNRFWLIVNNNIDDIEVEVYLIPVDNLVYNNRESIIRWFNKLPRITSTQTLTLGSTLLALLTAEDKKIATDKGWTLA